MEIHKFVCDRCKKEISVDDSNGRSFRSLNIPVPNGWWNLSCLDQIKSKQVTYLLCDSCKKEYEIQREEMSRNFVGINGVTSEPKQS